ncbi:histidine phosphatase family protein [Polynucleobacter sp. MG-27-Goln-C1]|uniref:histidine phosphatase family protein n=1 Tax=Polynucleobacter sp. MG-27-Goln-C1 TaxID=1819726 RepID=UPI001C0BC159|nr:histidine phosphatase family protein [Polynucleobacter sp. MG-27-Goln-C1]MBU3612118.1 histidine phosphatase family protein [Polynucleobacter sp. MG-27-Goln-C1]
MKYYSQFLIALLMLVGVQTTTLAQTELASAMQDGQHVLLMRHADAPGYGDPQGYQLNQCATQRNLGERGRKQAQAIGEWLTKQGITKAQVYSSAWCRCLDTATLLNKGSVKKEAALGSFFDDMSQSKKQTEDLAKLIQAERIKYPNAPIIMVTHHVNIESFTGKVLNSGDMILVKVNSSGQAVSHKLYPSP